MAEIRHALALSMMARAGAGRTLILDTLPEVGLAPGDRE